MCTDVYKRQAMDNSFEGVKSVADDICDDCENNGIAKYLMNM